jgi:hypothetical protein
MLSGPKIPMGRQSSTPFSRQGKPRIFRCNSLNSILRTALARLQVSGTGILRLLPQRPAFTPERAKLTDPFGGFECNGDIASTIGSTVLLAVLMAAWPRTIAQHTGAEWMKNRKRRQDEN